MSWRLRLSVETILRLTPAVLRPFVAEKSGSWRPLPHDHWRTSEFRGFSPPPTGGYADGGGAEPK
jgi:hypothetical protein